LAEQDKIKALAEKYGAENLIIVFGLNQPFTLSILAETFKNGDPSYAGPLAGIALGLKSYHIFELKEFIPENIWEDQMEFKELETEDSLIENIKSVMEEIRNS